jgi:hypothetical protein
MKTLDPDVVAVALSLLLYVFYVLLPVGPAVIIYRLFPETKVALHGPFQNFTLNATGAFAAYVVTVGLGYFLVVDTTHLINGITFPAWKIRAQIELLNENKEPIALREGDLNGLTVTFKPERDQGLGHFFDMRIPLARPDDWPMIQVGLPGFSSQPVDLAAEVSNKNATIINSKRFIELPRPIVLNQNRSSNVYDPLATELRPVDPIALSSTRSTANRHGGEQ